ncbi:cycle protein 20 homolog [Seminavis robusta]|uniref:Cycle protein 20 homolog n=1 Tax=Seminavis robusta TaxID=568900 RepID=A0A9N8HIE1_9STRA|nr:cycle protein 20 homolog [Seminavis robusta]|eukprot:Sro589_g171680.1 cycle protein 20 homolog (502) ;mRNA; f:13675-15180
MSKSVVEFENLLSTSFSDSNKSVRTGVQPRWERRRQQQASYLDKDRRPPLSNHNGDRFIPNRGGTNSELSKHILRSDGTGSSFDSQDGDSNGSSVNDSKKDTYCNNLSSSLLGVDDMTKQSRVLSFAEKAPAPKGDTVNNLSVLYSASASATQKKASTKLVNRSIPSAPSRILDAPGMMDDYYLNLLSWSDTNVLAVALTDTVYLWNASSGDIQELCTIEGGGQDAHISSVQWVQQGGAHLAVGTSTGMTQLWDVNECKQLRSMDGHSDRVGALNWNQHILSSGGRDSRIINHDVRLSRHNVATLSAHSQEVCSLKWSLDGTTLASGANDNMLCLWDASATNSSRPRFKFTDHHAAVKALAWSPHERNLLASGGGTADRSIKFWNTQTGALLNTIDTGSQVCSLQWNPFEKEILSSHGFARNQLSLWKYPSMTKIKELEGHTSRVLHTAVSPDGSTVVSAASDETLRFWGGLFAAPTKSKNQREGASFATSSKLSGIMQIR